MPAVFARPGFWKKNNKKLPCQRINAQGDDDHLLETHFWQMISLRGLTAVSLSEPISSPLQETKTAKRRNKKKGRPKLGLPFFGNELQTYFATCMRCVITPAVVVICKK